LHAKVYAELASAELVAVADVDSESLNGVQARYGVDGYADYHQLLERDDIDVVDICTTDKLHLEPVAAAARAGKHILGEKPLASTVEDCDLMIQAAAAAESS
jgi:predicted dehydrogenase